MGIRYWLAFLSLAITTLSVALDATMLSVSLPVGPDRLVDALSCP